MISFPPDKSGKPIHKDVKYELEEYPEDKTEPELEKHVAPAIRHHMMDFLAAIDKRSKPVADIEQGYISTAACILANMSMQLGRTLTWDAQQGRIAARRGSQPTAAAAVSQAVGASGSRTCKPCVNTERRNRGKIIRDNLEVLLDEETCTVSLPRRIGIDGGRPAESNERTRFLSGSSYC